MKQTFVYLPNQMDLAVQDYQQKKQLDDESMTQLVASKLFHFIQENQYFSNSGPILFLIGRGNNGLEVLHLAILCHQADYQIHLVWVDKINQSCLRLQQLHQLPCTYYNEVQLDFLVHFSWIVDGVYGSNFHPPLDNEVASFFQLVNASQVPVLAVDLPSGLNPSNGIASKETIMASKTLVCLAYKVGNFLADALDVSGEIHLIELDDFSFTSSIAICQLEQKDDTLPKRKHNSHKYDYGYGLIIGGSNGYFGAPCLSAHSALNTGIGLVSIAHPMEYSSFAWPIHPDVMRYGFHHEEELLSHFTKVNGYLIGSGIGKNPWLSSETLITILNQKKPTIIDAEGFHILKPLLHQHSTFEHVILTPHLGEFCRLFDLDSIAFLTDPMAIIQSLNWFDGFILLKGPITLLIQPKLTSLFVIGNPGLAKAGSGDVLAGILLACVCQFPIMAAIHKALAIFDKASNELLIDRGEHSMTATALIDQIKNL